MSISEGLRTLQEMDQRVIQQKKNYDPVILYPILKGTRPPCLFCLIFQWLGYRWDW